MDDQVRLPEELLGALAAEGGGRVALVIGAGSSREAPTSLPLAGECSEEAHRRLIEDGVLEHGECPDPGDLSALADTVHAKRGQQVELVERLPMVQFRNATPNEGYLFAAALLREHAIGALLTLNFDLALDHALAALGAGDEVAIVTGSHQPLGLVNAVHLHGDVNTDPEDLILRTEQLQTAWQDGWQELVTTRVMTSPVVVFAGLGSPAEVLVEVIRRIRQAIPDHIAMHVDPLPPGASPFSEAVEVPPERYIQAGWGDFMRAMGARIAAEQITQLERAVDQLIEREGYEAEEVSGTLEMLRRLNLVALGSLRAQWLLEMVPYLPGRTADPDLIAVLLYGVALAQRIMTCDMFTQGNGNIQLQRDDRLIGFLVLASGRGTRSPETIEVLLRRMGRLRTPRGVEPLVVLMTGTLGRPREIAPPEDLVASLEEDSIVAARRETVMLDIDALRANPDALVEALS